MDNPLVALLFKNLPDNYPRRLKRDHPYVLTRLMDSWTTPEFDTYMHDLLIGKRGKRKGFALDVIAEIMFINELHKISQQAGFVLPKSEDNFPGGAALWAVIPTSNPTPQGFELALEYGQHEVLLTFLDARIPVDLRLTDAQTPLIIATINGQLNAVLLLIQHAANLNLHDGGQYTALHWAAFYCHTQIINALLQAGADINAQQSCGETPLALAVTRNHLEAAKLLLEHKADPNVASEDGLPLNFALRFKNAPMIDLLMSHGAHK
jgi:hypothetical protein